MVGIGVAILYITRELPDIPVKPISIDITDERVERGRYLANHVSVCIDCHSTRDWEKFSGPIIPGTLGIGGEKFSEEFGFPGTFYSPNITPFNLRDWSDGEIYRAIASGVSKSGRPLFPVMPYHNYGRMDNQDIYSIIAYLRTIQPKESHIPASKAKFPYNILLHTIPTDAQPQKMPPRTDTIAYGRYMANAAACIECHTPVRRNQLILNRAFSGGREFKMPFGILSSQNITPDIETGIGAWTAEQFVERFKAYDKPYQDLPVADISQFQTVMPWNMYAGMSEDDLRAIYTYLQTLEPIKNQVDVVK
jgi:hypothetical protein